MSNSATVRCSTDLGFDLRFIILLVSELMMSLVAGYALGKVLQFILARPINRTLKTGMILPSGYGVFFLSAVIRSVSHEQWSFEVLLQPLLICMIGSFLTTNYSNYRTESLKILHDVGLPIYIAFFYIDRGLPGVGHIGHSLANRTGAIFCPSGRHIHRFFQWWRARRRSYEP